ncbi:hypothetical protein VQL36_05700 [Chengkuizengella sp. SCS-71B]|uniref:hypothetical protein n=1 Tax=Chengkuizengella sp. SCS-71B TaxID=3115290 RepID=UPI0032C21566
MIGEMVEFDFIGNVETFEVEIINVGEGIVVGRNLGDLNETDFFSSCAITRITPLTQQQINKSKSFKFRTV